jgi:hypothetical protein
MKKPYLREVTRMVRALHHAWIHPVRATLMQHPDGDWLLTADFPRKTLQRSKHSEALGGQGKLDAVAVARRLLAGLPPC